MAAPRSALLILLAVAATASAGVTPPPPPAEIAPHPRLVLTPDRVTEIKAAIAANSTDAQLFLSLLMRQAEHVKTLPPVPHGVPDATGILMAVRAALDIVLTSAAAHVFRANPSDNSYLDRAVEELLNLCVTWPDWNTVQHALDTGEAELATGLAYDWLYQDLNATTRALIAGGIQSRGLDVVAEFVHNRTVFFWLNNTINWNCVCTGGSVVAALALYGDDAVVPRASSYWTSVLQPLVVGVQPCVGAYNVDYSWEEGPGYFAYASKYNVWLFSALNSVLGNTAGLAQIPGVSLAARFPIYMTGANVLSGTGATFDWADSHEGQEWTPFAQWWGLPSAFNDTAASYYSRLGTELLGEAAIGTPAWGGFVEALAFYEGSGSEADIIALPPSKLYDYIQVGVFRSAWNAPVAQQNYLGLKGGNSGWNHAHEDLGSFVFDYAGARIAMDMGGDSYELPEYFGPLRWTYYRLSSLGHNVVLFDNRTQAVAVSDVVLFNISTSSSSGGGAAAADSAAAITVDGFAVVDLAAAYGSKTVTSYKRGWVSLSDTSAVLVVDEFVYAPGAAPANLTWQLHTATAPSQAGAYSMTLTPQGSQPGGGGSPATLALLESPSSAVFRGFAVTDLTTVLPDPPFDSAAGQSRVDLIFDAPVANGLGHIHVALGSPDLVAAFLAGGGGGPAIRPIADWATLGPLAQ